MASLLFCLDSPQPLAALGHGATLLGPPRTSPWEHGEGGQTYATFLSALGRTVSRLDLKLWTIARFSLQLPTGPTVRSFRFWFRRQGGGGGGGCSCSARRMVETPLNYKHNSRTYNTSSLRPGTK